MNQEKIGKFIASLRKEKSMTQLELAEKLNITDRAVSKWERGKGMPDTSIMIYLCDELGISVNELLCGERIEMETNNVKINELILEMARNEEKYHKRLMHSVYAILATSIVALVCLMTLILLLVPEGVFQTLLIVASVILFIIPCLIAVKFESEAGYYECKNCNHKFVPSYKEIVWAMHTPTKRFLKCEKCGKRTWCKKVMKK